MQTSSLNHVKFILKLGSKDLLLVAVLANVSVYPL
jgi:hypothetical protein